MSQTRRCGGTDAEQILESISNIPRLSEVFVVQEEFKQFHHVDPTFWKHFSGPLPTTDELWVTYVDFDEPVTIEGVLAIYAEKDVEPRLSLRQVRWLMVQSHLPVRGDCMFCCRDKDGRDCLVMVSLVAAGWKVWVPDGPVTGRMYSKL